MDNSDPECKIQLIETKPDLARAMHKTLISENPRWSNFNWDSIQKPETPTILEYDYFTRSITRHVTQGNVDISNSVMKTQGVLLNEANPELTAFATLPDTPGSYALSFNYLVSSGILKFSLDQPGNATPLWRYSVSYKSETPKDLTLRIDNLPGKVILKVTTSNRGSTRISNLQLQQLELPNIQTIPIGTINKNNSRDKEVTSDLTEDEIEALRAIGYAQ